MLEKFEVAVKKGQSIGHTTRSTKTKKIHNTKQKTKKVKHHWPYQKPGDQEWAIHWARSIQFEDKQCKNTQGRTLTPLISGGVPRCSRRVRSFSILRDTRHGTHIVMYDTSIRNKANNTNKIYYILLPNEGNDEQNIVCMRNRNGY
jgi:hypothetical protein